MSIRDKIEDRLNKLEAQLKDGEHLKSTEGADAVFETIASITKFTSVLSSADRDFLNAAKMAVKERKRWS
jgi:hypothetical protein